MDRLKILLALKAALVIKARAITTLATDEERDLTPEERDTHATLITAIETNNADFKAEQALQAAELAIPIDEFPDGAEIRGGQDRKVLDPKRGFANVGEFLMAVVAGSHQGPHVVRDQRLFIGADVPGTDYAQEAVGADGGFVIPPEFSATVRGYSLEEGALLPRTQDDPVQGNGMDIPVSEQTPWGTTAIRAFWEGEANVANKTKPVLEMRQLRLRKLIGLVPASNEIIADAAFMSSWLPRQLGMSIAYKTNDAIVNGSGTGQPNGFINGGSIVEQAAEGSQTADTININNVAKMYGRCINVARAVWLINPDAFNQIIVMQIGNVPAYISPDKGIQDAPNGRLLGLPLLMSETTQTLGDAGDIYLANLADGYQSITKQGGVQFDTSMHLWFDYDMMAFRAVFRMDGQTVFRQAVTPDNSTITRSHFVRLAARA